MRDEEFRVKLISELHDIALSLRAMSGRNIVKTDEKPKEKGYIARYFERSDEENSTDDSR